MTIYKYEHRPTRVEAMAITESNMESVARWCGGHVIPGTNPNGILSYFGKAKQDQSVVIPLVDGVIDATVGDVVVRDLTDGRYFVTDKEDFHKKYRRAV